MDARRSLPFSQRQSRANNNQYNDDEFLGLLVEQSMDSNTVNLEGGDDAPMIGMQMDKDSSSISSNIYKTTNDKDE